MNKAELVNLTLDNLIEHFKVSPESFEFSESVGPTIVFKPKIQLGDLTTDVVHDPNNSHVVVVRWNSFYKHVACYVFITATKDPLGALGKADVSTQSQRWLEKYRGNYKKLMLLIDLVKDRDNQKANLIYLRKLSTIFPDTMDNHIR